MKMKIDSKMLSLIGSLVMLAVVCGTFYYMWQNAQPLTTVKAVPNPKYKIVDLGDTLKQASTLVADLRSQATLPVTTPTADKVGKDDPFTP